MIYVKDLHKNFGNQDVLRGVTAKIEKGDKVVVVGPSGCGKSTFLRCLNLLERPSKGQIEINGTDITQQHVNINAVRRKIGMVFQNFNLFPHLTVLKNITLVPTTLKLKTPEEAKKQALQLLERIGLADKAQMYPSQLSGGQKQRIAIIRALAMEPEAILFDEPTSALDPEMVNEVQSLIKELSHSNVTMIIVTHEISFARDIATRVFFMDEGRIIEDRNAEEFFEEPKTKRAKDFLRTISFKI